MHEIATGALTTFNKKCWFSMISQHQTSLVTELIKEQMTAAQWKPGTLTNPTTELDAYFCPLDAKSS